MHLSVAMSTPAVRPVKRRNFSAKGKRFAHVDAVLALIARGMSVKAACSTRPEFPTAAQFNMRLKTDADLRARFNAACPRAGQSCPNTAALQHADKILKLIESGMSVRRACASDSRFPTRHSFVAALRYAPALELRYDLAMVRRERPHAKALAAFDEIEQRIIAGAGILDVLNSDRTRFPDYSTFSKMLKDHPDLDARYRAAGRARQAGPNALDHGPKYSPAESRRATFTSMSARELWRHAVAALPKGLDREARDDLANTLIVAMLEGEIDTSTIGRAARRLVNNHNREKFHGKVDSLDAPLKSDSHFSLLDMQTTW